MLVSQHNCRCSRLSILLSGTGHHTRQRRPSWTTCCQTGQIKHASRRAQLWISCSTRLLLLQHFFSVPAIDSTHPRELLKRFCLLCWHGFIFLLLLLLLLLLFSSLAGCLVLSTDTLFAHSRRSNAKLQHLAGTWLGSQCILCCCFCCQTFLNADDRISHLFWPRLQYYLVSGSRHGLVLG